MSIDQKKPTRTPDYRFIPCDSIGHTLKDNSGKRIVGLEDLDGSVLEQVGVMMTHQTAKLLWFILNEAIPRYEKVSGKPIQLNDEKVNQILAVFNGADVEPADSDVQSN